LATFQYCVIRKDLPDGVIAANVLHAAGEAVMAYALQALGNSMGRWSAMGFDRPYLSEIDVLQLVPKDTRAAVLEAQNESHLEQIYQHAKNRNRTPIVRVVETEGEYAGQLMALGFTPCNRNILQPSLGGLRLWRSGG
jgi:peptidyl-tRNA hydrolase